MGSLGKVPLRWRPRATAFALVLVSLSLPTSARSDELARLQEENARLRSESADLRSEIQTLRARLADLENAGRGPAPMTSVERVFVPQSRVSLETTRSTTGDVTSIATPWYRTVEGGPFPRKEWIQFTAERKGDGGLLGSWIVLDRRTGQGTLEHVETARLAIDGRTVDCHVDDYDAASQRRGAGRVGGTQRTELVRFALPPDALALLAGARRARFDAGPSVFVMTDEHITAAAALAARVQPQ
jgi:hypothetical protein